MNNPWQTLNSNIVHQNPYWQARQDRVIRPDGQETDYYLVERGDYVIVIALSEDRKNIFMIRQWRYPLNENSWEIPAGFIDQNETPLQAAQRELKEETGLAAKKWLELGKGHVSPGLTSQSYYIFLAQDLTVGERELEGSEQDMVLKEMPLIEAEKMVSQGEFIDGTSVDAFYRLQLYLKSL